MAKRPSAEIGPRVQEMLELIKLPALGSRYPYQLSGGQQQRVALARALAIQPKVLLLDEPLSALDAKIRVSLRNEIRAIQRKLGITTIYVTHDQEEALSLSDRIVVMRDGRVEQIGTPFEIYNFPRTGFVASFVGTLSILRGQVVDPGRGAIAIDGQEILATQGLEGARAGEARSVALRPEIVSLHEPHGQREPDAGHGRGRQLPGLDRADPRALRRERGVARHLQQPEHAPAPARAGGDGELSPGGGPGAGGTRHRVRDGPRRALASRGSAGRPR